MLELTKETFKQEVLEAHGKVLVYFYKVECSDCKVMNEWIRNMEIEGIKMCQVNGDTQISLRESYFLRQSPAILLFENGKIYNKQTGGCSETRVRSMVNERLDKATMILDKPINEMTLDEMKIQLFDVRKIADPMWARVKLLEKTIEEKERK